MNYFFSYDVYLLFTFYRPQIELMDIDSNDEETYEMEIDDVKGNC